ncbi:MAG: BatA domain-containing protein [Gammaproteobacteria bacterium]
MSLGWPQALIGLAALLVPLAIHLLQRGHHDTVEIATTQFVPSDLRPQWRWNRLRERWLWLLRSLLVIAACILLTAPYKAQSPLTTNAETYTLVSPQITADVARELAGEFAGNETELRWLAPGLPLLETTRPVWHSERLWGELWQADQELPDTIALRVIAVPLGATLGPERLSLGRAIEWIDAPAATRPVASPSELVIVHDADRAADVQQILEVTAAWRDVGLPVTVRAVAPQNAPPKANQLLWLSAQPWNTSVDMTVPGVIVTDTAPPPGDGWVLQRDSRGAPALIERSHQARIVRHFTSALRADSGRVNAPEFALALWEAVRPEPEALAGELRVDAGLSTPRLRDANAVASRRSLAPVWVFVVVLLAALERMVAGLPKRRSAS